MLASLTWMGGDQRAQQVGVASEQAYHSGGLSREALQHFDGNGFGRKLVRHFEALPVASLVDNVQECVDDVALQHEHRSIVLSVECTFLIDS